MAIYKKKKYLVESEEEEVRNYSELSKKKKYLVEFAGVIFIRRHPSCEDHDS